VKRSSDEPNLLAMSSPPQHPDQEILSMYLDGELSPKEPRRCENRLTLDPSLLQ